MLLPANSKGNTLNELATRNSAAVTWLADSHIGKRPSTEAALSLIKPFGMLAIDCPLAANHTYHLRQADSQWPACQKVLYTAVYS